MRMIGFALFLGLLAGPALAQGGKGAPPSSGPTAPVAQSAAAQAISALPMEIAGYRRNPQLTDFEARPNGAGLGAGADYQGGPGDPAVTVFLYDRRRGTLSGDANHHVVSEELDMSSREIAGVGAQRGYRVAARRRLPDLVGPAGPALRCDQYDLAYNDNTVATSYACLGLAGGRIFKFRATHGRRPAGGPPGPLPEALTRALFTAAGGQGGAAAGVKG
ncbi:hypothetical protein [Muricoccus radiodurans]|uniref:hypothetical protein n=1 Tax=Muricoccus radiodurans TaxID=2231721 RepID=UPI003CF8A9BB